MDRIYIYILISFLIIMGGIFAAYYIIMVGPEAVAEEYLQAWEEEEYGEIHQLLEDEQKQEITPVRIKEKHLDFLNKSGFKIEEVGGLTEVQRDMKSADYSFTATLVSRYFGENRVDYTFTVVRDGILGWGLDWSPRLIYPELSPDTTLQRERIEPERGGIYDRHNNVLAEKRTAISVGIKPGGVEDEDLLTEKFDELLDVAPEEVIRSYRAPGVEQNWFIPIKTITREEYRQLDPELRPIPGVYFRKRETRVYPRHELASHVAGYIGEISREYLEAHRDRGYQSGDLVGKSGIEKALEPQLRGKPGYRLLARTGDQRKILLEKPVEHGSDVQLTLDLELQQQVVQALGENNGAVCVLDPREGEVLALVSQPNFDPNLFSLGMSNREWRELSNNPDQPLFNKAVRGLYPPGSVFKLITGAAALDTGLVDSDTEFNDTGQLEVSGNVIKNFEEEIFNTHTFSHALINSINTTFARIGLELGADTLREYAENLGFTKEETLPLRVRASTLGDMDQDRVTLAWSAIGQGEVTCTPFQMARVASVIGSSGRLQEFTLIRSEDNHTGNQSRSIKEETAEIMKELMAGVVEEGTGEQAWISGLEIAGKTGTAEIDSHSGKKPHAWFVGFVPVDDPGLVFSVFVENGGVGGRVAAPIARNFLERIEGDNQEQGD